jgi:tRNA pseudouridine38-40 synthase
MDCSPISATETPGAEASSSAAVTTRASSNWKLVLAYDGTDFDGWQVQPGRRTIQGELAAAVERLTGEHVLPQGSGRTDAGVHALAQVASFRLAVPIPPANLQRALNHTLPEAIRVLSAEPAADDFHARHSATGKTYHYRICRSKLCQPWLARYVYHYNAPLNIESMQSAAAAVLGEHDFTSFAATDPDRTTREDPSELKPGNVRTIRTSSWKVEAADELLVYTVTGSGFLHHMVRNLVGTLLDVGRGLLEAETLPQILAARSRKQAGPTAPARGLFLASVDYDPR